MSKYKSVVLLSASNQKAILQRRGEYMKKPSIIPMFLLLLLLIPVSSMAGDHPRCQLCGMDLNRYTHVRYTINTIDNQQISTCGVQCGLLLQLNLGNKFDFATATTLLQHQVMPAEEALYVYKSDIITDMSPGFIEIGRASCRERVSTPV